jgi:hypothetical protein
MFQEPLPYVVKFPSQNTQLNGPAFFQSPLQQKQAFQLHNALSGYEIHYFTVDRIWDQRRRRLLG